MWATQNARRFADDVFKCMIFLFSNTLVFEYILLVLTNFNVSQVRDPIDNTLTMVKVLYRRQYAITWTKNIMMTHITDAYMRH